ncbi:alpha-L-fucosidase [Niabella hirudinis]|uniref:alpha-L-fucosidase n=1 Tax=Niabella hirudinis TaxID=1285929 RepID=UPI003EC0DDBD
MLTAVPAMYLNPSILPACLTKRPGPFMPTLASLKRYTIPDWFRNAKFGIWAHWGPQSAIEAGDWYARSMYMQGSKQYKHHVAHYGHPSKFGYKDTIKNWKAEAFDADYLMGLYKNAGARYFMTMGVHHDNFDLWNSRHNPWNSVQMGPKKDIVGLFKKAAKKQDLKFGISDHLWITPKWFSVSKGSDKEGPLAGVGYDGAGGAFDSLYGDSKEVYTDLTWTEEGISEAWKQHWYERIKDLVDQYEPDLLYSDGQLPFQQHGYNLLAHHYNKKATGKKTEAVYTSKRASDAASGICVFDVERGVVDNIWPQPWQTDTCIGDWHYNKDRVGHYKSAKTVIDLLVDIVSRNGNLMLNFPLPASGMLDSDELKVLDGITQWMKINSEAIYDTRPWKIFGTGPQPPAVKNDREAKFNESSRKQLTFEDVRFTKKGNTLYAFFMGWPESGAQIVIKPLSTTGSQKPGIIENIELLGAGKVTFKRDEEGLKVNLPGHKPCEHAYALKISGKDLT